AATTKAKGSSRMSSPRSTGSSDATPAGRAARRGGEDDAGMGGGDFGGWALGPRRHIGHNAGCAPGGCSWRLRRRSRGRRRGGSAGGVVSNGRGGPRARPPSARPGGAAGERSDVGGVDGGRRRE